MDSFMDLKFTDVKQAKLEARKQAKRIRKRFQEQLPQLEGQIQKHIAEFLRSRGLKNILSYHAFGSEVSLAGLPTLLPECRFYAPKAHTHPQPHLSIHPWNSPLERSALGMLEPSAAAEICSSAMLDAVLLPGLAFDHFGVRLGYGGGFYDRFLLELPPDGVTIGVCISDLFLQKLPKEHHDQKMDFITCEKGVFATLSR
jgi:5-formyltetrahydrofolate cyclo-ligase